MRNLLKFSIILLGLLAVNTNSYSQATNCATAASLVQQSSCDTPTDYAVTNGSLWTYIVPTTGSINLQFKTPVLPGDTPTAELKMVKVYSGTCSSLTLITSKSFAHSSSLPQTMYVGGLTSGSTYYVEVQTYYNANAGCRICRKHTAYLGICAIASPIVEPCLTTDLGTICCTNTASCQYLITACIGENITFALSQVNISQGGTATWTISSSSCASPQTIPVGNSLNCSYSTPGYYTASVMVVTASGETGYSPTIGITILPQAVASFTFPSFACVNEQVCFTSNSTPNAPTGLTIYFGDGNSTGFCSGSPLPLCDTVACHTYSLPGTYNVCVVNDNNGCTDSVCQTITIGALDALFSASTVCVGQPTVFTDLSTCTGANVIPSTYLWNFGDNTTSSLQNPQHTYAAAGTYSVTLSVTNNNNATQDTYSMNVVVYAAPSFTITGTNSQYNVACGTEQYCITPAISGNTYTITAYDLNGNPLLAPGTTCLTVNWASLSYGGGYIVASATNQQFCTTVDTITVLPCCTSGTLVTMYNDSTSNRFGNGPTSINGNTFYLNGLVVVNTNVTLTNCTLLMGPNAKILVRQSQYGPVTFTINKSYVWSGCGIMWDGIYIEGSATASLDFGQSIMEDAINGVVSLNKGHYNISSSTLNRNLTAVTVNPFAGTHTGRIANSTFKCVNSLNAVNTNNATLLPPYAGQKSEFGVKSLGTGTQQGTLTVGDPANISYRNTFTAGLKHGIYTKNVNLNVYNNTFDFILIHSSSRAVWAEGRIPTVSPFNINTYTVNIGSTAPLHDNYFKNCRYGAYIDICMRGSIKGNTFEYTPIALNNVINGTAITYRNTTGGFAPSMLIQQNAIKNATVGISGINNTNCSTTIKECNILTNLSTLNNAIGIQLIGNQSSNGLYTIYNNDITSVRTGITGSGLRKVNIDGNRITVKPSGVTRGVVLANNIQCRVVSNIINASPAAQSNTAVGGVVILASSSSNVTCNNIQNIHHSIKFEGTATVGAAVYRNALSNGTYGYWLHDGPVLGNQGSLTQPSDNSWSGSFTADTWMSDGPNSPTIGNLSRIYYRSSPSQYIPTPNGAIGSSMAMAPQSLTGSFAYQLCSYPMPAGWGHGAKMLVINDQVNQNNDVARWLSSHSVYRDLLSSWDSLLAEDSTLVQEDSLVLAFVDSMNNTVTGSLEQILAALNDTIEADYDSLLAVCQNLTPTISPEGYMQSVLDIILTSKSNGVPIDNDALTSLREIATLCPLTDGVGVYMAREVLAAYDSAGVEYVNSCEVDGAGGRYAMDTEPVLNRNFLVYPNPAQDDLTIEYLLTEGQICKFELFSVTGKKVATYDLPVTGNVLKIDIQKIPSGAYFYYISVNNIAILTDKLVVIR